MSPEPAHFSLLEAYAPRALLERAFRFAERAGYLGRIGTPEGVQHELGDSCLILNGALRS